MVLVFEIALGVLLGWILIQLVQRIGRIPQERVDKAKAKIDAIIAEAVEKGDTRALRYCETMYRQFEGHKPKIDFEAAIREAEERKQK